MKEQLTSILSRHGISEDADVSFVQVARDAAASASTPASAIVSRFKFEHPDDNRLATAIAEAVQSAQRKGRLIVLTMFFTAVPLAVVIAAVALNGEARRRALSEELGQLRDQYSAAQNDARKVAQDFRDASGRATDAALTSQQSVSQNAKTLALEFAATTKVQADEIASLKAENNELKENLAKLQQGKQP